MRCLMFISTCLIVLTFPCVGCSKPQTSESNKSKATALPTASVSPTQEVAKKVLEPTENPSTKMAVEPVDAKLTYALVVKDVNAYKGKRVRWFGIMGASESTIRSDGATSNFSIVYDNNPKSTREKEMRPFVVEDESDKKSVLDYPFEGWIKGTIKGKHTIGLKITSSTGKVTNIPKEVPVLTQPEFESKDGKK